VSTRRTTTADRSPTPRPTARATTSRAAGAAREGNATNPGNLSRAARTAARTPTPRHHQPNTAPTEAPHGSRSARHAAATNRPNLRKLSARGGSLLSARMAPV